MHVANARYDKVRQSPRMYGEVLAVRDCKEQLQIANNNCLFYCWCVVLVPLLLASAVSSGEPVEHLVRQMAQLLEILVVLGVVCFACNDRLVKTRSRASEPTLSQPNGKG